MNKQETAPRPSIAERLRRIRGRPGRCKVASTKVTQEEQIELKNAAKREGKVLSEWARDVLLTNARTGNVITAIFTELIALRLLTHGVARSVLLDESVTPAQFDKMLTEVKQAKHDAARDVLSQYAHRTQIS